MLTQSDLSLLLILVVLFIIPGIFRLRLMRLVERGVSALAERPWLAIASVTILSFAVSAALTVATGVPPPVVHDEFSYLLSGDTFAHFRLTNPTSPLWRSFETFHVLQTPSYQSKYPPGLGLFLALGQLIAHLPIVGVWISAAMACGALCWAFYAWLPRRWAVLGGLLTCLHPAILKWADCYWGGCVSLFGGALLFGGVRRVVDGGGYRSAILASLGAGILILSRPYEGGVAIITAFIFLLYGMRARLFGQIGLLAALAIPLVMVGLFLGLYNHAVTGSAVRLPYVDYEQRYGVVPAFLFQSLKPVTGHLIPQMRTMAEYNTQQFDSVRGWPSGYLFGGLTKLIEIWRTLFLIYNIHAYPIDPAPVKGIWENTFEFALLIPLVCLPAALKRDRWLRLVAVGAGMAVAALLVETWFNTHYAAPSAPLAAVLIIASLRQLHAWTIDGKRIGRSMVRVLGLLYLGSFFVCFHQIAECGFPNWAVQRARFESRLEHQSRPSLVVVCYSPAHHWGQEWVYNGADLENAHVLWARSIDPIQDARLLAHYRSRQIWLCEADKTPPTFTLYEPSPQPLVK